MPEPSPYIPALARWIIAGIALSLLVIACALPAFYDSKGDPWVGFNVLWCGVFGIFIGQVGWFANPITAFALLSLGLGWQKTTIALSAIAVFVALHTLQLPGTTIPLDEGMVNKVVCTRLAPGFYLWMTSLSVPAIGTFVSLFIPRI